MNRTPLQNASLHLWMTQLADELNAAGFDVGDGVVIKLPVKFTQENIKENIVKVLMNAMYPEIESTTQLNTIQMQKLYRQADYAISQRTGVTVAWPSVEEQSKNRGER